MLLQAELADALAQTQFLEHVHGSMLQHARPQPALHVLAAGALNDDRLDAFEVQHV